MPTSREANQMETYSGRFIDFRNPNHEDILIEDIAAALANTCRFAGHVTRYYSVAEHAIKVSEAVPGNLALPALHHDSHEAYLYDIIRPLKNLLEEEAPGVIDRIAAGFDAAIGMRFGIDPKLMTHPLVKAADDELLYREAAALKWSHGVGPHWNNDKAYVPLGGIGWSPGKAERMFLARHAELTERV